MQSDMCVQSEKSIIDCECEMKSKWLYSYKYDWVCVRVCVVARFELRICLFLATNR